MEIKEWNGSQNDLMRIIQESVPGKQITMAHIISSPDPVIYKKLGLDPRIDYKKAAIGVLRGRASGILSKTETSRVLKLANPQE